MCGIAGWVSAQRNMVKERQTLVRMSETLANRGPDSSGYFTSQRAALGHRRLAVIDPSGGIQPMTTRRGGNSWTIVYNGELYNTEELRRELQDLGYRFITRSDTEVLLAAVIQWGKDAVKKLNGIYAFAVWDEGTGTLIAARDPLGVKPLFYCFKGDLLFASEIKALLAHPDIEPVVDQGGLLELFGLGPARSPECGIFRGIQEVPPGHMIIWQDGYLELERYWQLQAKPHCHDLSTTIETVRSLLTDAIKRQLVSDVPLCTFLSGGLDSSAISAVAAQELPELNTWSLDYKDNGRWFKKSSFQPDSDSNWIKLMSAFIGSTHHNVTITADELAHALSDSVQANDLPGMADIDSSLFLFSRAVRKQATVALSGECADEIFGGYPWYWRQDLQDTGTFPWSNALELRRSLLSRQLETLPLEDYVQEVYQHSISQAPVLDNEPELDTKMRRMYWLNLNWFMLTLLNRKDRMSMANSLEVRVPFADIRIVEYMYNIPWQMKYLGNREKGLLRTALTGLLPEQIVERRKSPWPKTHNPAYLGLVKDQLKEILADNNSPLWQIVNKDTARKLVNTDGDALNTPWFGQLMTGPQLLAWLVQIEYWLCQYKVKLIL